MRGRPSSALPACGTVTKHSRIPSSFSISTKSSIRTTSIAAKRNPKTGRVRFAKCLGDAPRMKISFLAPHLKVSGGVRIILEYEGQGKKFRSEEHTSELQ